MVRERRRHLSTISEEAMRGDAHSVSAPFRGFRSPNYTMVPDELFDEVMADCSGAELKVLLYIVRRTFGFKKQSDDISLNQICHGIVTREGRALDRGTGLSKSTVQLAIRSLLDKRVILAAHRASADRGFEASTYRLNVVAASPGDAGTPIPKIGIAPCTDFRPSPVPIIGQALCRKSAPQETVEQETDLDSMPPTPTGAIEDGAAPSADGRHARDRSLGPRTRSHAQPPGIASFGAEGTEQPHSLPARREETGGADKDLMAAISALAQEMGDDAPLAASLARARGILQRTGLPLDVFLEQLDEAAERTRAHQTTIVARRRDGHTSNGMPYLFAVLERLPDTPATDPRPFYPRQPRRVWRANRSEGHGTAKYTGGSYGVCPHCLCSPCDPECITRQATATPREDGESDTSSHLPGGGETAS